MMIEDEEVQHRRRLRHVCNVYAPKPFRKQPVLDHNNNNDNKNNDNKSNNNNDNKSNDNKSKYSQSNSSEKKKQYIFGDNQEVEANVSKDKIGDIIDNNENDYSKNDNGNDRKNDHDGDNDCDNANSDNNGFKSLNVEPVRPELPLRSVQRPKPSLPPKPAHLLLKFRRQMVNSNESPPKLPPKTRIAGRNKGDSKFDVKEENEDNHEKDCSEVNDDTDLSEDKMDDLLSDRNNGTDHNNNDEDNCNDRTEERLRSKEVTHRRRSCSELQQLLQEKDELRSRLLSDLVSLRAECDILCAEKRANDDALRLWLHHISDSDLVDRVSNFLNELEPLTKLLVTLKVRHVRVLQLLDEAKLPKEEQRKLEQRRDKLQTQIDEAKILRSNTEKRQSNLDSMLQQRLSEDSLLKFRGFVKVLTQKIGEMKQVEQKVKLGEEQLLAINEQQCFQTWRRREDNNFH